MLEQQKTPPGPKDSINRPSNGGTTGIRDKKLIVEVFPVKMSATLEGHSLTLSGPDDASQLTIDLLSCTVVAVSASNLPSRKWLVQIVASLLKHSSPVTCGEPPIIINSFFLSSAKKRNNLLSVCIIMLLAAAVIWILDLWQSSQICYTIDAQSE